jgi:hypothetical protein
MKAIKFKTLLLLVVFGIAINTSVRAQNDKVEKKYHKEYSVTANSKLYLENKYGDIDVRNWDKNQVTIDLNQKPIKLIDAAIQAADLGRYADNAALISCALCLSFVNFLK